MLKRLLSILMLLTLFLGVSAIDANTGGQTPYTIKFNANGGTGTMANQQCNSVYETTLNRNTFTYSGYSFEGWALSADGSVAFPDEAIVMIADFPSASPGSTVNLYAKWKQSTITVEYNGGDANGSVNGAMNDSTHNKGTGNLSIIDFFKQGFAFLGWKQDSNTNYVVEFRANGGSTVHTISTSKLPNPLPSPTRDGYQFEGWYSDSGLTNKVNAGDAVTKGMSLYAKWTETTPRYNLNYEPNGGSAIQSQRVTEIPAVLPIASGKTGYGFDKWYTDSALTTEAVGGTALTQDTTLYAGWTQHKYTVQYNANKPSSASSNVTGTTANSEHNYNEAKNLTANGYSLTGWTFDSWNTKADGTGTSYANNASVKNLSNTNGSTVILYAQWRQNTYTITYDANKPSGATANVSGTTATSTHTYEVAKNLTSNGYSLTGWTFAGWNTKADGSGTNYSNGASVKNLVTSGNLTLYAKWTANTYTVNYNGNGNTGGSTASSSHTYDVSKALTANGFTKTGYTFAGWNTLANGNGTSYANSASVKNLVSNNSGSITLYAQWSINNYTLTFNPNGGSVSEASRSVAYNADYGTLPTPTRTGYTFAGWFTAAEGGTQVSTTTKMGASNVTIYAHWTINSYTITYNLNGGTVATANPTNYNVTTTTFTLNNPTKTGYTFTGWTGSNGSTPQTSVSVAKGTTGNLSYTANWTVNSYEYNIVYKSTSGKQLGTAKVSHNYGTTNTVSPQSFTGYTSPSNQSVVWDSTTPKTITFTYTPINYTITWNLNNGSLTGQKTQYNIETANYALPSPTKNGYGFSGWYGASDFSGSAITSIPTGSTGNKTFYAKWNATSYTITYVLNEGTNPNDAITSYTIENSVTLPTPTRSNYTFLGWYGAADFSGSKITSIAQGSTGNKTFYAKWKINIMYGYQDATGYSTTALESAPSSGYYKSQSQAYYQTGKTKGSATSTKPSYAVVANTSETIKMSNGGSVGSSKVFDSSGVVALQQSFSQSVKLTGLTLHSMSHTGASSGKIFATTGTNKWNCANYNSCSGFTQVGTYSLGSKGGTASITLNDKTNTYRSVVGVFPGANSAWQWWNFWATGQYTTYYPITEWNDKVIGSKTAVTTCSTESGCIKTGTATFYYEVSTWGSVVQTDTPQTKTATRKVVYSRDGGTTWTDCNGSCPS